MHVDSTALWFMLVLSIAALLCILGFCSYRNSTYEHFPPGFKCLISDARIPCAPIIMTDTIAIVPLSGRPQPPAPPIEDSDTDGEDTELLRASYINESPDEPPPPRRKKRKGTRTIIQNSSSTAGAANSATQPAIQVVAVLLTAAVPPLRLRLPVLQAPQVHQVLKMSVQQTILKRRLMWMDFQLWQVLRFSMLVTTPIQNTGIPLAVMRIHKRASQGNRPTKLLA